MSDGYSKTEVCEPIIAAHRHHCFVAPEVWEVDASIVCGVCQAKNATLISALIQKIPSEIATPVPVNIVKAPVISITPRPRMCYKCGSAQINRRRWDKGIVECFNCQFNRKAV